MFYIMDDDLIYYYLYLIFLKLNTVKYYNCIKFKIKKSSLLKYKKKMSTICNFLSCD